MKPGGVTWQTWLLAMVRGCAICYSATAFAFAVDLSKIRTVLVGMMCGVLWVIWEVAVIEKKKT